MGANAQSDLAGSGNLERNDAGTIRKSGTPLTQPVRHAFYITDDELRARYGDAAELLIDALDRRVETQKFANFSRDREAVEAVVKERGL